MNKFRLRRIHLPLTALILACCVMLQQPALATPFGQGKFGANTPFGSLTSLSLSFSGNVAYTLTPSGGNYVGSGSGNVTVTTNDANGYRLYLSSPTSTTMTLTGGGDTIPASANSSPSTLAVDTWGFNITGSTTNFQGMLTSPTLIKETSDPYTTGDTTTVTFGTKAANTKSAGAYTVGVVYTAAPLFE